MIPIAVLKRFSGAAVLSTCSAITNMVATVLVFRSCGAVAYANFMIDLAIMSLVLLVLELIPSNYSLYRVQDDPSWRLVIKRHLVISACVLPPSVIAIGSLSGLFQSYTPWIALFAITQVQKRYLDILLQASGNVREFMWIELSTSLLRMVMLSAGIAIGAGEPFLIWGSLSISAATAQVVWISVNGSTLASFAADSNLDGVGEQPVGAGGARKVLWQLLPYYPAIVLRRLKDNILPLAGGVVLGSKELLGLLMLSYRGLLFANGQVRIFEAVLAHRKILREVNQISFGSKVAVAFLVQLVAIGASATLIFLADDGVKPYGLAFFVSLLVWPMVFYALERANAYSKFEAMRVNLGLIAYICAALVGALLMWELSSENLFAFVGVFLIAEVAQYLTIKLKDWSVRR